jgi:hypothetical protein
MEVAIAELTMDGDLPTAPDMGKTAGPIEGDLAGAFTRRFTLTFGVTDWWQTRFN